jgi:hypothetical protein
MPLGRVNIEIHGLAGTILALGFLQNRFGISTSPSTGCKTYLRVDCWSQLSKTIAYQLQLSLLQYRAEQTAKL